jgi:hypothetical protein
VPLDVIQMPNYQSGWSQLNVFADKLVNAYKEAQLKKWDNEWMAIAISDIENANKQDDLLDKIEPPSGYIDTEGIKQFSDNALGMLQKKELMAGGLNEGVTAPLSQLPDKTGEAKPQLLPDVQEFNDLYKFVSELPTGKVDWTNSLNIFKKRLESKRALGSQAEQFLNMILGQAPTDQRAKFEADFNLAGKMKDVLYPNQTQSFDPNEYLKANPDMEITGYNSNTGGYSFGKKKAPETQLDTDALNAFMKDNKLQVKGITVNEKGEKNISLEPIGNGELGLKEMLEVIKGLEAQGYNASYSKNGLSVSVPEPKGTTTKKAPTYEEVKAINKDLLDPLNDYDTIYQRASVEDDLTVKGLGIVTKADRAKKIYDYALAGDDEALGINNYDAIDSKGNNIAVIDKKGNVKDVELYEELYNEYEQGAKEYYEATGKLLPKEYLSLEEAGTHGATIFDWNGGQNPVLNTKNVEWSFLPKIGETRVDDKGIIWKYIGDNKWESIK